MNSTLRFLHAADIHLGNHQYNLTERSQDFFNAFQKIAHLAVEERVSVCVIAGDLFHKATIDPYTLIEAEHCLAIMKDAGIQVVAIAGNHDRVRYRDRLSWLEYLHQRDYLTLLDPPLVTDTSASLVRDKSYVDINGVRFIGLPWYGASTTSVLKRMLDEMGVLDWNGIHYSVLMAHVGVEGQLGDLPGNLLMSDLSPMRSHVQYLALGHLHKPYEVDSWIYNPGAIENCDFNEASFTGKGAFIVTVTGDGQAEVEKRVIHGRPFYTLDFGIDRFHDAATLLADMRDYVRSKSKDWPAQELAPVVRLVLHGHLAFDRTALDLETVRASLEQELGFLSLRLTMQMTPFEVATEWNEEVAFERLEREVFEDLARSDARFSQHASAWASYMRETKDMGIRGAAPAEIYQGLTDHMITLGA